MSQHAESVVVQKDAISTMVYLDGRAVAAFGRVPGMDTDRWAEDFAASIRRHIDGEGQS